MDIRQQSSLPATIAIPNGASNAKIPTNESKNTENVKATTAPQDHFASETTNGGQARSWTPEDARKIFASRVHDYSFGGVPSEEVIANAVVIESAVSENPSTLEDPSPILYLSQGYGPRNLSETGKEEYKAIVAESKELVLKALGESDSSKLSYLSPGWEEPQSLTGSFNLDYAREGQNQKVRVYASAALGVPGGLLFIDTNPDARPTPNALKF